MAAQKETAASECLLSRVYANRKVNRVNNSVETARKAHGRSVGRMQCFILSGLVLKRTFLEEGIFQAFMFIYEKYTQENLFVARFNAHGAVRACVRELI